MARLATILALCIGALACTEPRSQQCRDVCSREAACHDELETHENFDEGECLDACAALERDSQALSDVQRHAECVRAADTCQQVFACNP